VKADVGVIVGAVVGVGLIFWALQADRTTIVLQMSNDIRALFFIALSIES
jgi:hypothetical protein